jgi:hypothetical protein
VPALERTFPPCHSRYAPAASNLAPLSDQLAVENLATELKQIIGDTLRSHSRPAQETETRIAVNVLNRMLDLARPESVRAA